MKLRRLPLLVLAAVFLVPSVAYAQASGADPATMLSLPLAVSMTLSVVIGVLNMGVQTGSLFGIETVPKPWLPDFTLASTFLAGVAGYLAAAATPWTGATAFVAVVSGIGHLLAGAAPALAKHAHATLPAQMYRMRRSLQDTH